MAVSITEIVQDDGAHNQIEERLNRDLAAIQNATKRGEIIRIRQVFLTYLIDKLGYLSHWHVYYDRIHGAEIERLRDPGVWDMSETTSDRLVAYCLSQM